MIVAISGRLPLARAVVAAVWRIPLVIVAEVAAFLGSLFVALEEEVRTVLRTHEELVRRRDRDRQRRAALERRVVRDIERL